MLSKRGPWLRVALCLLLAGSEIFPAAPAMGAIIQARSAAVEVRPGFQGFPVRSASAMSGVARLGASLGPGLIGAIPSLTAAPLIAPALAMSEALAASEPVVKTVAGPPENLVEGLVRTESAFEAAQERGDAKVGAALDSLYGEKKSHSVEEAGLVVGAEVPAVVFAARLLKEPVVRAVGTVLSARILQIFDASGQNSRIEVDVSDLLRLTDAQPRSDLSRRLSREALGALGSADPGGRQAAALADFLRDIVDDQPVGAVSARLEMDGRNHYRLVFERADGSRKILSAQFLPARTSDGPLGPTALVLMGPAEVSSAGQVRQGHPGYWREYAGGDRRLQWSAAVRVEKRGWGPWAYWVGLRDASVTEQSWREGSWRDETRRLVKTVISGQTRSWLGRAEGKFMQLPVLSLVLKLCDDIAETILTGLLIVPHGLVAAAAGSRLHNLEAGADLAKNPLLKFLRRDQWHLDRLGQVSRDKLFAEVREERGRAVNGRPFPVSPELIRQIVDAPIGAEEAVTVLRRHYGIGTFGTRIIQAGAAAAGWKRVVLTTGGVLAGALEGAADSVCNPLLWAMLGLSAALGATEGIAAGASVLQAAPAAGALAGTYALKAVFAAATVLWGGPWLFSAADHVGRIVELTAQGEFDQDFFEQLSKVGTDALYCFVIP